ncbi:MAG: AbrB/MazE/SpoVT family DNA-binding domain-containing protein, partial [Actinomycetia bacterium]|nr:AbrB/MazE/SpoVT family DNA-binding domain-containing protein [Actinomycetes bacterium]
MATATVSSKYQVVIPKEIRQEISIRQGQVVQVIAKG